MAERDAPPVSRPKARPRRAEADTRPRSRRGRELASLNAVAEVLNRSTDLREALTRTLTLVASALGLHSGWVWLLDEQGEFFPAATYQLPPHLQQPEEMTGWHCLCLRTFVAGDLRGAANINVLECTRLQGVVDGTDGLRFHASIPLYLGGRRLGVMNVAGPQWSELSAGELQFLYTVGYQVGLAVEHTRLLETRTRLAQVEERNRLAREIHDTVAQTLAGLTLQLEAADALIERDPSRAREAVRYAAGLSHAALEDVRRSVLDLRAAPLEGLSLGEALRRLVETFDREQRTPVRYTVRGVDRPLSPRIEVGAFRIAQEALANVAHHAAAQSVSIALDLGDGVSTEPRLRLTVEDDGRGFDPSEPVTDHFGLLGMRERARLLGGRLAIASAPNAGTRIELELPP